MGAASAANTRQMEMMNQGRNGMYGQNAGNFREECREPDPMQEEARTDLPGRPGPAPAAA